MQKAKNNFYSSYTFPALSMGQLYWYNGGHQQTGIEYISVCFLPPLLLALPIPRKQQLCSIVFVLTLKRSSDPSSRSAAPLPPGKTPHTFSRQKTALSKEAASGAGSTGDCPDWCPSAYQRRADSPVPLG